MQKIKVENAVGTVLAHDVTRIVPGEFKGVAFKKGHIVQARDIDALRRIGKLHLYVLDLSPDRLHEDDAAVRICAAICGDGIAWTPPVEGKANMISQADGLLKIDAAALMRINDLEDIIVSTLKTNTPCKKGQIVAATRIIPLTTRRAKIEHLEAITDPGQPVLKVLPFNPRKVGAVVTGTEVYQGIIHDAFDEFVKPTVVRYGSEVIQKLIVPDDTQAVAGAIRELAASGCDLIITTGGLSVDPDDVTKAGVLE
ncbi:MAG: molybdopterin-binding protein, partial [Gammaproteobacteria bacterium]|nr:molybdopterin-binding protein [Gammaproteobacteria bacterium]